jgi:hypothetical protein
VIFTTCSHKITLFTTFNGKIGLSSFPQEMNRPKNLISKGFEAYLADFLDFWVLRTVENPHFDVYNW